MSHSATALEGARSACEGLVKRGVGARMLDRAETERLVLTRRYLGGLIDSRGAAVQPLDLVRSLGRAAAAAGAKIHARTSATTLERSAKRWRIATARGRLTAGHVIVATNGYRTGRNSWFDCFKQYLAFRQTGRRAATVPSA